MSDAASTLFDKGQLSPPPWRTERLLLRPYTIDDLACAHEALDRDEEVWRFDPGHPPTKAERRATIERFAVLRKQFGFGPCAAFLVEEDGAEGTFIGQGGLNPYVYDYRDGRRGVEFEVMYKLALPFWGKGYATELARFWMGFAFEELRLSRLLTCPEKANARSVAVLERLGATFEPDWLDDATVIAALENPARVGTRTPAA